MLAGVFAYVALIALVVATVMSAGLAMTRMTIARATAPYLSAGYQRAAAVLQQTLASQMQNGGIPFPAPTFAPLAAACANSSCTYTTTATIAITQSAPATPGPACDVSQSQCAPNVQTNAYVCEARVTAAITVTLHTAGGGVAAVRSGSVVLRTMNVPPYAAIAGSREGTFDGAVAGAAAGDDGGAPPATPNPCASAAVGTVDDTTVRVAYRNRATKACTDGSSWANASYGGAATPPGWNP